MKRRLLTGLCLICLLMNLCPVFVHAEEGGECGENATWFLSDDGVLTISGSGPIREYIYEGADIWPLNKAPWREYYAKVKKIVINSGITRISDNAFCCLPNVTSVSIPDTVTSIGQAAFCDDISLNNVVVPNSVTSMEKSIFRNCKSLTDITLPSDITSIGEGTFRGCIKLSSVALPPKLSVISYHTFDSCISMKSITIHEGITEIQASAFETSGLTSIHLPESLKKIGSHAFYSSDLTQITIPENVTEIVQYAFGFCESLKRVQFMGSAPSIDSHVFCGTTITAYYPKDDPSWTEDVRKDYEGTITWVGYCGKGHTWGEWETVREATCTKTGLKTRSCTQCDMTEEESLAKTAHQYESVVTPPTCIEDGYTTHTCKVCKDSYTDSITPAGDHAFGEWAVIKEATCVEKGSRQRSCIACNVQETEEIEPSGHDYREEVTAPSCTQKGFTTHICTVCADTFVDTYTEITEHTYGEWTEVKPATWREEGEARRQCVDCADEQTKVLPKLPVNWGLVTVTIVGGAAMIAGAVVAIVFLKKKHSPK